jgi:hypothetical protein
MSYRLFHDFFPDLAERETRLIHVSEPSPFPDVPSGEYALLETFCTDKDCDCRRVMWMVMTDRGKRMVAVVAYGWGSARFYQKWFGSNDADIVREMQGPILNMASPQSESAPAILNMLKTIVLNDMRYMDRVKRHYTMFRDKIETGAGFLH